MPCCRTAWPRRPRCSPIALTYCTTASNRSRYGWQPTSLNVERVSAFRSTGRSSPLPVRLPRSRASGICGGIAGGCSAFGADALFSSFSGDLKNGGRTRRSRGTGASGPGIEFAFLIPKRAPTIVQAFDIIAVPSHASPSQCNARGDGGWAPVVGSRVGGIPEMVVEGETGFLVPPAAPGALADAIERLSADTALRARMSPAARRRSSEAFGLDIHARRLQSHYDQLCLPRNAAGAARGQLA